MQSMTLPEEGLYIFSNKVTFINGHLVAFVLRYWSGLYLLVDRDQVKDHAISQKMSLLMSAELPTKSWFRPCGLRPLPSENQC